jgi:regulation of enolase protein 1 (concanavalin A-like superfamily)
MGNPIGSPNIAGTEIDICEHRKVDGSGVSRDGNIGGVIHWDGYGADHRSHGYDSGNLGLGTGYHIYGMEWTPTQQKFYIDGVLRWTINNDPTNSPVSQRSEFIILSSEVEDGGWSAAVPAGGYGSLATTTTKMVVDYVRVYRRAETVVNGDLEGKIGPFSAVNQTTWSSTGGRTDPAAAKLAPTSSAGATVSQTIRGLLPDTGYTVTAWGNAGITSPSLFIGAKDHGGAETGQTLTTPTYAQATAPFTTSTTHRTATVLARSNNSGSTAYADEFVLRRHATVNNGQLESGDDLAWAGIYGGSALSSDGNNYGGSYAWKVPASGSSAGVEQNIVGLSPNTTYRLTGWTTNGNAGLSFGVKNHGGSQVTSEVSANTWTKGTVNFTTGSASTSATIFAYRGSSSQTAYADSFFLSQPLTAPWVSQDVTDIPLDGTAGRLGDKFVVQTSGAGIGGTSDKMHLISQPVTGDATITARILGVDHTSLSASTGVMIRESNSSFTRNASLTWSPRQTLDFTRRTAVSGSSTTTSVSDVITPPWVRLTRRGNVFTAYSSPDGLAWSRVGTPQTIAMTSATQIGIAASSGNADILTESTLDSVSVTAPIPDVSISSPADGTTFSNTSQSLRLTATINASGTPAITWSKVSGPGNVVFANPAVADTSATFSAPGTHVLRCSATTAAGTGSDDHTVNVAAPATADPSLVLRLKLDESSGSSATDSSGSGNHGTATGGLTWQPAGGVLTGAAAFNGSDSYISVPDNASLDNTSAFTLSYRFKANSFNGCGLVAKRVNFDNNNSYGMHLTVDGRLNIDINSNNDRFTSSAAFNPGAWYHVALVFDGSLVATQRAKLYINGTLDTTADETSTAVPNFSAPLYIGTLAPGNPVLDGLIDEVRFHRRALTATEVAALESETDNYAPLVSTGPAPAAITQVAASLTGNISVEAGPEPTAVWSRISGPGNATFAAATAPATTVTFDQPGTHVLRLTATTATAQTSADLTVTAAYPQPLVSILNPPAPVALANAADVLHLTASASSNGAPGSPAIVWSQFSGPGSVTFSNPAAASTSASFSAPGTYILRSTATTAGGSSTADTAVSVAAPASLTLRQGENAYNHAATFLRADSTAWNSGARDQFLVGKSSTTTNYFRSVLSFAFTGIPNNATLTGISLDLWTHPTQAGTGSVAALELRELAATPVEGSGNSSTDPAIGAGTGATWSNRTATTAWTSPGGDFGSTVLSSVAGFNATATGVQKTFPSSSAFLATAQAAHTAGQPLNLMLLSPLTESGSTIAFTRIASDDHTTTAQRPRLTLTWSVNPAPVINPGPAPAAVSGTPAALAGTTSGATSTVWSLVSGPGTATFAASNNPATTVTFSQPGSYLLRLRSSNPNGEVSRTLAVEVTLPPDPADFSDWQQLTWPGVTNPQIIGPAADPDADGLNNLLEWALHLNATSPETFKPAIAKTDAILEYTYTRRKTAPGEAIYQVEWSDTLGNDWSSAGVTSDPPVQINSTTESVRSTAPAGTASRRFLKLRVSSPFANP